MITEYIVPHGITRDLPTKPAAFIHHFEQLFKQIPKDAVNPKVDFIDYPGVYEVSYDRILTAEEEEEAMEQARETNRIATENLIKEEKAELKRLLARYGHE